MNSKISIRKPVLVAALVFVQCCTAAAQSVPKIARFLVDGVISNEAAVGATLTIQGAGFGDKIGYSYVTLNGMAVAGQGYVPISWSDTSIVTLIPKAATSGLVVVYVGNATSQRRLSVRVEIVWIVCFFDTGSRLCNSAPVGTRVEIAGNGFGTIPGKIVFNGVEAVNHGWLDSSIDTVVPEGATTGLIRVQESGVVSNGWRFTVTQ